MVAGLPTVGILLYDKVLTTEVTASLDVFTKHPEGASRLFNVITIAQQTGPIHTEEGMRILPDYDFDTAPPLTVLVIPSAYDMSTLVNNPRLIEFIKARDRETRYTMSNCSGAQLVGESGIAKGRKIVTWIGGGPDLQKAYPDLRVQDDSKVTFVQDGKYFSSNGNLASYISALELLEEMTNEEHRKFVESYLYLERLQDWPR